MKNFKNLKNFNLIMLFFYIAVITSWVIYEIFTTIRFKPEQDNILDLWYFIGLGLIILPIFIKKILIFDKNKVLKIFLSFLSVVAVATLAISIWFFSPHYLTKSSRDGLLASLFASKEEKFFYKKLEEFILSDTESIELKELTNFEWDHVCYVMPYGGINRNFESVKIDKVIREDDNDGKFAVVFISGNYGKVFRISRKNVEVSQDCYDSNKAKLKASNGKYFFN